MINRFKKFKKLIVSTLILIPLVTIVSVVSNEEITSSTNASTSLALSNDRDDVVIFKAGVIESSNDVLARCDADTTYTIFGEIFNSKDRVVGLNSQDTTFSLTAGNTTFNFNPYTDICISYSLKKEYLRPNERTKAKFTITNKGIASSNWELPRNLTREDFSIVLNTKEATDALVESRIQTISTNLENSIVVTGDSLIAGQKLASIDNDVDINDGIVKIAIGSLIFLALCPIAVLIGIYANKRKSNKEDQNQR